MVHASILKADHTCRVLVLYRMPCRIAHQYAEPVNRTAGSLSLTFSTDGLSPLPLRRLA